MRQQYNRAFELADAPKSGQRVSAPAGEVAFAVMLDDVCRIFLQQLSVADHKVATYDGDLDDYRRMVLSARGMRTNSRDRTSNERAVGRDKPVRAKSEKRVPLKQRISEAEAEIARINGIISKIDTALALPDLFKRDPKQAAQLGKARAGAANALQRAEEEWLAASSQYDEATG